MLVSLTQFDGGMVNDPRDTRENVYRILKHFDAFTNKHKLTPYRSAESGNSSASTHQIANFLYALGIFYGLGTIDGSGSGAPVAEPALYKKTDLLNATWAADSHSTAPTGAIASTANRLDIETPPFIFYPTTARIYGVHDARYIWYVAPGSSFGSTDADLTSFSYVSNFLRHSKDDVLYLGYDNKIASKSGSSAWTVPALTLPANYVITQLVEFGNYLAIGCRAKDRTHSKVFLWDRDSSVNTLAESIDWGEGELLVLDELEGLLVGVSFAYAIAGATTLDDQFMHKTRTIFRYYAGAQGAVKFQEFTGSSITPPVQSAYALTKQKINNRVLFMASIPIGSTGYQGIWSIGRNSVGVPFGVTIDRLINAGTTVSALYGFMLLGDYMFAAYATSGVFGMDKTNDSAAYTTASVMETTINPKMPLADRPLTKKLIAVAATYEPLPSGAQVVVQYRVNGGSWVTVFTETTVGAVATAPVTNPATEPAFSDGEEYEFRIESTGGAEITGMQYKYIVPTNTLL